MIYLFGQTPLSICRDPTNPKELINAPENILQFMNSQYSTLLAISVSGQVYIKVSVLTASRLSTGISRCNAHTIVPGVCPEL